MYIIIELSALCVLHDDEDVIGGIEDFVEFDDILVVDEFEYFDLSYDLSRRSTTLDIIFLCFILR